MTGRGSLPVHILTRTSVKFVSYLLQKVTIRNQHNDTQRATELWQLEGISLKWWESYDMNQLLPYKWSNTNCANSRSCQQPGHLQNNNEPTTRLNSKECRIVRIRMRTSPNGARKRFGGDNPFCWLSSSHRPNNTCNTAVIRRKTSRIFMTTMCTHP